MKFILQVFLVLQLFSQEKDILINDMFYNSDINILRGVQSSTPITFGGGIRNFESLNLLKGLPFERFTVTTLLFSEDISLLESIVRIHGNQALVGLVPFKYINDDLRVFCPVENKFVEILKLNKRALDLCDEVVFYDTSCEGLNNGFNEKVIFDFGMNVEKCVLSGGAAHLIGKFKKHIVRPSSILIENKVLHTEYSKKTIYDEM